MGQAGLEYTTMIRDPDTLEGILDSIRKFVSEALIPREYEVAETDDIPADVIEGMRELGLFGLTIPEEYGGLGVTMEEEVKIAFELGRTSPAFRSYIGTNNGIGSIGILLDGTEGQKAKYLPRLATGELIGSFCLTEPDAGSDAGSLKTTAVMDGNHYVINGTKRDRRGGRRRSRRVQPGAGVESRVAEIDEQVDGHE
jgi:acyl-CoA dehydrogenase